MSLVPYEGSSDSEDDFVSVKRRRLIESEYGVSSSSSSTVNFFGDGLLKDDEIATSNGSIPNIPKTHFWTEQSNETIVDNEVPIFESTEPVFAEKRRFLITVKKESGTDKSRRNFQGTLEVDGRRLYSSYKDKPLHAKFVNCSLPSNVDLSLCRSHTKAVRRAVWCPHIPFSNLAASISLDGSIYVWDMFSKSKVGQPAVCLQKKGPGVKGCCWKSDGRCVLTGGFGKAVQLWDVETKIEILIHHQTCYTNSLIFHHNDINLYLAGGVDQLTLWDIRQKQVVKSYQYKNFLGQINDAVFLRHRNEFIAGCDVVSQNSSDRTVMVFDVSSGSLLSSQIFSERFTCTRFYVHPNNKEIFCQTNGDYIITVSANPPYKLSSRKRFDGHHSVEGYPVGIHGSPDGRYLASASADGRVVIYNSYSGHFLRDINVSDSPVLDVNWHSWRASNLITSCWDGSIHLLR